VTGRRPFLLGAAAGAGGTFVGLWAWLLWMYSRAKRAADRAAQRKPGMADGAQRARQK
jgi:hypothetical protein